MKPNMLIDTLPQSIEIDGRVFPIYSDFRTAILIELLIADNELSNEKKLYHMLTLFYEEIPENIKVAIDKLLEFFRCGQQAEDDDENETDASLQKKKKRKKKESKQVYSFEYDDSYIFAAFLTQYGIDLNEIEYLHWWKFSALFRSLNETNKIVEIMGYRAVDISTVTSKTEKARINKMKALYALPDNRTIQDKVASIGSIFGGGLS